MNDIAAVAEKSTVIVVKVEPDFKERVRRAAESRDGGNMARLIRRAIERTIVDEQLDIAESMERAS